VKSLELSLKNLLGMVDTVQDYVNKVLEGKVNGDSRVGRFLADTVSSLPRVDSLLLENIFNSSLQDLLLVVYLSNLTRTQLLLSEKLQKVV